MNCSRTIRALMLGDIVGRSGRRALKARLPGIRSSLALDLVIANGENAAGGIGLTTETLRELLAAGVDVVTGGNHTWRHADIYNALNAEARLLRPANAAPGVPGRGHTVVELACGVKAAVINLLGRTFMDPVDCPFRAAEEALAQLAEIPLRFVDFHAEATSEKRAMAFFLSGRVTAVAGTHTHAQTADAYITPEGTAYISDLGMCGAEKNSVLGMAPGAVLERFLTGLPSRFTPAPGEGTLNGLLLTADAATGRALSLSLLRDAAPEVTDPGRQPC